METVPAMESGKSAFIVTGDPSRNKSLCVPGGGFATVKIALPKAWDALMAERGYKPLAEFRLATDLKPDAAKMKPICFDTCQHVYRLMGEVVAQAFSCGKELM